MAESGCLHVLVDGRVQGVGYRWFVRSNARELGLNGWCANLADGRVEVFAEGPLERLVSLRASLSRGPRAARVTEVVDADSSAFETAPQSTRICF